jgi:hypothetical protein
MVVAVGDTGCDPDEFTVPMLVPMFALIETEVALVTFHVKVADSPEAILVVVPKVTTGYSEISPTVTVKVFVIWPILLRAVSV